jgi:multidrug resistance efflux pump
MKRKIIIPILLGVVLGGGVVYYKAVMQPRPIVLTGIVTTNEVIASSQIQGRLAQVLVKEGDLVTPGQLLAVIDPQELRADESYYLHSQRGTAAQVSEAEAALKFQEEQTRDQIKQAEAALAAAQAQAEEASADLELDRLNYQRTKGLNDQKIVSEQSLDQARAAFEAQ